MDLLKIVDELTQKLEWYSPTRMSQPDQDEIFQVLKKVRAETFEEAAKISESFVVNPHEDYFVQEYRNLCMEGIALKIRKISDMER